MYIRVHFLLQVCETNLLLRGTIAIHDGTEYPFRKPFENRLSRSVPPCTLLDASFCSTKTSLLHGTTDIRVRSENARSVQKSTAGTVQNVHPCTFCTYVFAGQTRY